MSTRVAFSEVQAHVLIGFFEPFQRVLFFRIVAPAAFKVRAAQILDQLTWTREVVLARQAAAIPAAPGKPDGAIPAKAALAFAYRGLEKLLPPAELRWLGLARYASEAQIDYYGGVNATAAFRQDCHPRANAILLDPMNAEQGWRVGGPTNLADGVLIFAGASRAEETAKRDAILAILGPSIVVAHVDEGEHLPEMREHFGFIDGLSRPVVDLQNDENADRSLLADVAATQIHLARHLLLLSRDLESVEPPGLAEWLENGSFLVYRRLNQQVTAFHRSLEALAEASGVDAAEVGARVMGRRLNGEPLIQPAPNRDEFDYDGDVQGVACPFSAHVRRVNLRIAKNPRPLFRRSIPFGPASPSRIGAPVADDRERGLLFLCYQASIERQFEYVNGNWSNSRVGARPVDALVGRRTGQVGLRDVELGLGATQLESFVTASGAGYFLAPARRGFSTLFA